MTSSFIASFNNTSELGSSNAGAGSDIDCIGHFSIKQVIISFLLIFAITGTAYQLHQMVWLELFGMCLLAFSLSEISFLLAQKYLPGLSPKGNWGLMWIVLCAAIVVSDTVVVMIYQAYTNGQEWGRLNVLQAAMSSAGFSFLILGYSVSKAQIQCRTFQMANLKQIALSAELKALQAQVEPHFLFNTLANTRYLARHDPEKAVTMLDHLIAYLHSALPDLRASMSSLEREFDLARHYLALMQIRFGERLNYSLDLPEALCSASLPPLMLMSLVENAIQHGVEPHPGDVTVEVTAKLFDRQLVIIVRDNGAGFTESLRGSGVGLRNLRERLQAMYQSDASFELRKSENKTTESLLSVPLSFIPVTLST